MIISNRVPNMLFLETLIFFQKIHCNVQRSGTVIFQLFKNCCTLFDNERVFIIQNSLQSN